MSLDAQDWVWEHSASKGTARLVLLAIADKASGAECSAYAGTTMLIKRTNASRRAVITAVDALIEAGEIEVIEGRTGPKGETWYKLPKARKHRRGDPNSGGADSAPVQDLHRCENCTGGGADSAPGGCTFCTGRGADSAPHNACNAEEPKGTQRERAGARGSKRRTPAAPPAAALSHIAPDWRPSRKDRDAAAADLARLTDAEVASATAKFIRHHTAKGTTAADFGPLWVTWLSRERQEPPHQGALLLPLPGGGAPPSGRMTRGQQAREGLARLLNQKTGEV